jgi:HSP20 family protein
MSTHNTRAQRHESAHRNDEHSAERPRRHDHEASSPFTLMRHGIDEMDRWFSRLAGSRDRSWMSPSSWMPSMSGSSDWSPAIEAFQRGNEFVIRAEVPGMTRTDLHVEAGDDTLTIRGERKQEHREDREGLFWTERSYGSFCRVIPLPAGTIADSAKASFSNGVLEVVMSAPSEQARRGRRIDISGQ